MTSGRSIPQYFSKL